MKTLIFTIALLFTLTAQGQTLQINNDITPKKYKLVNNKTAVIVGLSSFFVSGFLQNMHTIYVTEPQYMIDKFGWPDHRDNQNVNLNNGGNSLFSFAKNPDHALQAGTTLFACAGATALTVNYYFVGGFNLKGKNTLEKIGYIVAPLVAGRLMMGIGGQFSNLWIKGQFDPL